MSDYSGRDGQYRLHVDPEQPAGMDPMAAEYETSDDASPHYTVGDELRMRREAMGKSIADVVDAVRIQSRYLEALEDGRIEDLPGTVYAIGFVRTYAEYLDLDGAEAVARYKEETQGLKSQIYVMPEPLEEGKVPTAAILLVAVVLAAAAYGVWYYMSQPGGRFAQQVPEVPERLSTVTEVPAPPVLPAVPSPGESMEALHPPAPAPPQVQESSVAPIAAPVPAAGSPISGESDAPLSDAPPAASASASLLEPAAPVSEAPVAAPAMAPVDPADSPPAGPTPEVAVAPPPAALSEPFAAASQPEALAAVAAAVPEVPAAEEERHEARVYGLDNAAARIVITAEEDAWLEVTDSDDARLFSRVLRKGDSYRAPNREGVKFVTGNAGGLRITVDGQAVPPLGPPGLVRRDVKLDPDLLLAGRAWP